MRRDAVQPRLWRVALPPATVRSDGWRPLQALTLPDLIQADGTGKGRRCVFWLSGGTLGVSFPEGSALDGEVTAVGALGGTPLSFAVASPGVVRVGLRHAAPVYLTYGASGAFTLHGPMPMPAPMSFAAEGNTLLSEQVGAVALSGAPLQGGALSDYDVRLVSKAFTDTYRRLLRRAADAGMLVHPVLMRYRLEDAAGDTLFLSPVVLVSGAEGFQCTGQTAQALSGTTSASGGALQARGYTVRLLAPDRALASPWCDMVRRAVVEMSEEIDPVDADGLCTVAVTGTGTAAAIQVSLPGAAVRSGQARSGLVERALRGSLGRMKPVAVIDRPFSGGFAGKTVAPARELPGVTPSAAGAAPWRDGVSYAVAGTTAGLFCGASPLTEGFGGYAPSQFATVRGGEGAWQGVAAVTLRRGNGAEELAVATAYGASGRPTVFSPVLSYPDPDATSLRLSVRDADGKVLTRVFPLVSWPEGGMAYWVSPGGETHPLLSSEAPALEVPAQALSPRLEEGTVAVALPDRPGTVLCREKVADGAVIAVADAPRSAGSWDFSRRKLLVYGEGGTVLVTLDSRLSFHSSARLDLRPATWAVPATGGKGEVHLALAGGSLLEVGASGTRTLLREAQAASAGYDSLRHEYLLAGGGELPRRLDSEGELSGVLADGIGADASLMLWEGRPLLCSGPKMFDCSRDEEGVEKVRCAFTERYAADCGASPGRLTLELSLPLTAELAEGTVIVSADNGSGHAAPLVSLAVSGPLRSPLRVRVPAPCRTFLEVTFRGYLSPDASWSLPEVSLRSM